MRRILIVTLLCLIAAPPLLAQMTYTNGRFGFSIERPVGFSPLAAPDNGDGQAFLTPDKKGRLTVYGSNNIDEETPSMALANQSFRCSGRVLDSELGDDWYRLSWVEDRQISYLKCYVGPGSQNSMLIEYPAAQKKRYQRIVKGLEASFRPGDLSQSH